MVHRMANTSNNDTKAISTFLIDMPLYALFCFGSLQNGWVKTYIKGRECY